MNHSFECRFIKTGLLCSKHESLDRKVEQLSEAVTSLHSIAIHQQATIESLELRLEAQHRLLLTRVWGRNIEPQRLETAPPIYKPASETD